MRQIDDPGDIVYENQCLFLRTLNAKLGGAIWSEINDGDLGSIDLQPQSDFPPTEDLVSKPSSTGRTAATKNESSSLSSHGLGNNIMTFDIDSGSPSALVRLNLNQSTVSFRLFIDRPSIECSERYTNG